MKSEENRLREEEEKGEQLGSLSGAGEAGTQVLVFLLKAGDSQEAFEEGYDLEHEEKRTGLQQRQRRRTGEVKEETPSTERAVQKGR